MSPHKIVVVSILLLGAFSSMCRAQAASTSPSSQARWRALLGVLTDDTLAKRPVGSAAHARVTTLLRTEVSQLAERSGERVTHETQPVPFGIVTPDSARSIVHMMRDLIFGLDYVPLSGFGLEPPDSTRSIARVVGLGGRDGITPQSGSLNGAIAAMQPPRRADGAPEYQLSALGPRLRSLKGASAVFVVTRDLMPRRIVDRLLGPRLVLQTAPGTESRARGDGTPVAIAITRSLAYQYVLGSGRGSKGGIRIVFRRDTLPHRSYNLVATIPGQDSALRSEFVVLVAHLDTYETERSPARASEPGSAAAHAPLSDAIRPVSLLALAEELAASPVQLRRSILLLWTSGYDRGQLGLRHFLDSRPEAAGSIAAIVSVDELGGIEDDTSSTNPGLTVIGTQQTTQAAARATATVDPAVVFRQVEPSTSGDPYAPDGCNSVLAQAAQRGIPALALSATPPVSSSVRLHTRRASASDVARLAALVDVSAKLVRGLANADTTFGIDAGLQSATCPL